MVPILKHMYSHSCTDCLYKQCLRHFPWYWKGSLGSAASTQLLFRSSTPHWRFYYPLDGLDLWVAEPPFLYSHKSSLLCLFASYSIYSACMLLFLTTTSCSPLLPNSSSSYSCSHIAHLTCISSISKQTHFLLTPCFVAVICCACQVEY